MSKNNAWAVFHLGKTYTYTKWAHAQRFIVNNRGFKKHRGFPTMKEAEAWCDTMMQEPDPELPEPIKESEADREEVRRLFKLVATELREYGTSRPKVLALTFDKLSTEF